MTCRSLLVLVPLVLVALAGCNLDENFAPSLSAGLEPDGSVTSVVVTYGRGTGHDFSDMHATINGTDLGPAAIDEGRDSSSDGQVLDDDGPAPSSATWLLDPSMVVGPAHIVIDDGDEFILDVTFGPHGTVVNDCSSNLTC